MNLRNWNKAHTYGLLLGLITPLLFIPIVLFIRAQIDDYNFTGLWNQMTYSKDARGINISLAAIANLVWFHLFMRREKYPLGMGVILATFVYLLYIVYLKFL